MVINKLNVVKYEFKMLRGVNIWRKIMKQSKSNKFIERQPTLILKLPKSKAMVNIITQPIRFFHYKK